MTAPATLLEQTEEGHPAAIVDNGELTRLQEQVAALNTRLMDSELQKARLEERAEVMAQTPTTTPPPDPTREQLTSAVSEGTITQEQMDGEIARQMRNEITKEVTASVTAQTQTTRRSEDTQEQFDAYIEAFPDVKVEGSLMRQKVFNEIAALRKMGMPNDLGTEVIAMRNVCGSEEKVEETTRLRREVHVETGAGAHDGEPASGGEAWTKGLTKGQIASHRHQLTKGVAYNGPDDPLFLKVCETARKQNAGEKL